MELQRIDALMAEGEAICARNGTAQRELLRVLVRLDHPDVWDRFGAQTMAHFVSMWLGLSYDRAERWVACAHALEELPVVAAALESGELSVDKVVELTRFATPEDSAELVAWARRVSPGRIRYVGELRRRTEPDEASSDASRRSVRWWFTEGGRRFLLDADLPSAEGLVVSRALARLASRVPAMPGEEHRAFTAERRADALVALASASLAADPDLDRATVVLHATPEALASEDRSVEAEGGAVVHASTARRLACTARVQAVLEDASGIPIRLGRVRREPSAWMLRQLRHRDRGCVFPGCGRRGFSQGHHVRWWGRGGGTDLDNLVLVCHFHHRLVHEHRWSLERDPATGAVTWHRPDGSRYDSGPAPPVETVA